MTEYAVLVKHSGFIDRFLKDLEPPKDGCIGSTFWWADEERDILRFRRQSSAEQCKNNYQLRFAANGETAYSFVVMKTVMVPKWVPADD
jgi:hypothetical protein